MSVDDRIQAAQAAWKKKDAGAAVRALEGALADLRKEAPLEIRVACPINHDHTGLGLYTPAAKDVVDGRRVRLYLEVANHVLTSVPGGAWRAQLDVTGDFSFEDPGDGTAEHPAGETTLQKGVGLGTQAFETRTPAGVTSFGVEINLGDKAPPGTYHVWLHVKDAVGNKSAQREARFVLT